MRLLRQGDVIGINAIENASGFVTIVCEREFAESLRAFIRARHSKCGKPRFEDTGSGIVYTLEFHSDIRRHSIDRALEDWKDWATSPVRRLLSRITEMRRAFKKANDGQLCKLQLASADLRALYRSKRSHWQAESWNISPSGVHDLRNAADPEIARSIFARLCRNQGIAAVVLTDDGETRIDAI